MPSATGTAMSSAIAEVITVPKAMAAMPNFGGLPSANQDWKVKKFSLLSRSAGIALTIRNAAIATMITRTVEPAAVLNSRNTRSAPNRWPLGRAPPPPETGASAGVVASDWSAMPSGQGADRGRDLGLQFG